MNCLKVSLIITVIILSMPNMYSQNNFEWNREKKIERKKHREDSTKWDMKNLKIDSIHFLEK
jgi:hypothetical protein